jgi:hypothetical protein
MDKYWKYRERGHRDEQRYMDYVKQFEEVNTLLKMEMRYLQPSILWVFSLTLLRCRTLKENQWRFKDVHLRKVTTSNFTPLAPSL